MVVFDGNEGVWFWVERSSGSAPQGSPSIRPCSRMELRLWSRFRMAPNMYCDKIDPNMYCDKIDPNMYILGQNRSKHVL